MSTPTQAPETSPSVPELRPTTVGRPLSRWYTPAVFGALVVGNTPIIHGSLFGAGATIPSWIASSFREATSTGLHRSALLGLALILVALTFGLAAVSRLLVGRTARTVGAGT